MNKCLLNKKVVRNINRVLIKYFVTCLSLILLYNQAYGQADIFEKSSNDIQKAIFLGNSITYDGRYVSMIESVLLNANPDMKLDIINLGLPSETVSGLSEDNHAGGAFPRPCLFERLDRLLEKIDADIAFVCYGMNDGIFLPFENDRFDAYTQGMNKLYNDLLSSGVKRIIVITPPVHDDSVLGLNGYNKVLDSYSQWLLDQRELQGWEVVDIHFPMKSFLEYKRTYDSSFKLANDGIHPDTEGHWLMAREIIAYLYPDYVKYDSWSQYLATSPEIENIYENVIKYQDIIKHFWLGYIGHNRPGIPQGLSVEEANNKVSKLKESIAGLLSD